MGVDTAVGSAPIDWLKLENKSPSSTPFLQNNSYDFLCDPKPECSYSEYHTNNYRLALPQQNTDDLKTEHIAFNAKTLQDLQSLLDQFDGCGLRITATKLCFYRGSDHARVMVIGEAPGRDEDLSGRPFVGRAGQLLDKMLDSIQLDGSSVHYTNVVYWRPPGNRTPTTQEVLACRPFLEKQIDLVAPDIIITVGGLASKIILETSQGIMKLRGNWGSFISKSGTEIRVMPTLHPAYLLRTPASKLLAWRDLLAVKEAIQ